MGSLPPYQGREFEARIMGASPEEMGSETLRPLPDLRARALVGKIKTLRLERNGASSRRRPRVPQICLTTGRVVRDGMTMQKGMTMLEGMTMPGGMKQFG